MVRTLRTRVAFAIALWFGAGRVPLAPGTAGSVGALPLYFLARGHGPVALLVLASVIGVVGVWSSSIVAREIRQKDPSIVVVDEVVGTLVALSAASGTFASVAVAFALFRIFDAVKPFPARAAERLPGGFGIVLDDVVAGIQAALVVVVLHRSGVLG